MLSHGLIHRVHRLSAGVAVPHYSRIVGYDQGICFFSLWLWRKIAGPSKEHCGDLSLSALLSISGYPNVLCVIFFTRFPSYTPTALPLASSVNSARIGTTSVINKTR